MNTLLIDSQYKFIQDLIGDANLDTAFSVLGDFVDKLKDNEMSNQLTLLKAHYSREMREYEIPTRFSCLKIAYFCGKINLWKSKPA